MYASNTEVAVEKSQREIQQMVRRAGAKTWYQGEDCAIYFDYGRALAWWVKDPTKPLRFDLCWPAGVLTVGAA